MPTVSEDYRKKSPVQGSVKLVCTFRDQFKPPHSPPTTDGPPRRRFGRHLFRPRGEIAGKTKNIVCTGTGTSTSTVPQSILRKQNQGSPRAAAAHSGPAFDPMGARLGPAKSVRFSCGNTIIPQVFNPAPPTSRSHPDPDPISVSGRPRRVRRSPDRLGISVDPLGSPLGGEL
jgi:hypothetical protein